MKKRVCPACSTTALYVTNALGERKAIYVTRDNEIIPTTPSDNLEGFDLETIYCFGCSWSGTIKRLK
ncbi:MAG TPA: hypothetical protein P5564_07450 [Paludibacteraceae bacterium]|jgi:hypothetical protein|nr:hypothetical protein [Paludibacteraceae bacterium]HRS68428.1 hypothetical protein [Paludibacteraceae bacterium]